MNRCMGEGGSKFYLSMVETMLFGYCKATDNCYHYHRWLLLLRGKRNIMPGVPMTKKKAKAVQYLPDEKVTKFTLKQLAKGVGNMQL